MVVCIHVSNYYSRGYGLGEVSHASYEFSLLINGVSRLAVPIFFMISGFLLLGEPVVVKKNVRRVRNMLLTLLLWSGIYLVWNYFYRDRVYDFRLLLEEPVKKHLWYLYVLVGLYVVLPFLQTMFQNLQDNLLLWFAGLWFFFLTMEYILMLCKLDVTYPVPLVGTFCYVGYFALGYIIKCMKPNTLLTSRLCYAGAGVALAITIILTYALTVSRGGHYEKLFEYRNPLIAIAAGLVFYDVLKNAHPSYSERTKKVLQFLAKHSFTIYLCHILFLDIVKLQFFPRSINAFLGIPLYCGFVFAGALAFSIVWNFLTDKVKKNVLERRQ